eukprot:m51a1_g7196 putative guanylate-binding protein (808) ;mRNA; f:167993-178532
MGLTRASDSRSTRGVRGWAALALALVLWTAAVPALEQQQQGPLRPGRAVQLLRPDPSHRFLEPVDSALEALARLDAPRGIAVVAAVGPYHGGKSFLLNVLASASASSSSASASSFTVGARADPETRGLWAALAPRGRGPEGSEGPEVLLVDTEGFFAGEGAEEYDARVFAAAALLSSALVYNSVRVVDQAHIDYLELLARRTQLLGLRESLGAGLGEVVDSLQLPPLLWVVRDFAQDLGPESPSQWLLRLLRSRRRDPMPSSLDAPDGVPVPAPEAEAGTDAHPNDSPVPAPASTPEAEAGAQRPPGDSLLAVFPSVECWTLPLPSTRTADLRMLDPARAVLSPDFTHALRDFAAHLRVQARPRTSRTDGRLQTGAELATVVRVVARAVNGGNFPRVPSVWEGFLRSAAAEAQDAAQRTLDADLEQAATAGQALSPAQFQQRARNATDEAEQRLRRMLFGLRRVYGEPLAKLRQHAEASLRAAAQRHASLVGDWCDAEVVRASLTLEERLGALPLPQSSRQLADSCASATAEALADYEVLVAVQTQVPRCAQARTRLGKEARQAAEARQASNKLAIEKALGAALQSSRDAFARTAGEWDQRQPLTVQQLEGLCERAQREARATFDRVVPPDMSGETLYAIYTERASSDAEAAARGLAEANRAALKLLLEPLLGTLRELYLKRVHVPVPPIESEKLETMQAEARQEVLLTFDRATAGHDAELCAEARAELLKKLDSLRDMYVENNARAMREIADGPIRRAREIIASRAVEFWRRESYREFVRKTLEAELAASKLSDSMRASIAGMAIL